MILSRECSERQAEWSDQSTGGVWLDKMWVENIIPADNPENVRLDSVFCPASKRTLWHRCQGGEVLIVTSGEGRVASASGERRVVRAGDAVYFAPRERHWHGAGPHTLWTYLIRSVGPVQHDDVVDDEEYNRSF